MVKVPEYDSNVVLRPTFRQGVDVRASPDAFGAELGRGMQALSKGADSLDDSLARVQALEDETIVRRERNNYLREKDNLQYHPENGYLQKQGQNALGAFPQYLRDLDELRRASASKLTPQQQRMFEQAVNPLDADARRSGLVHKGTALKSFVVDEAQSGAESFKNQALLNYRDGALWQKYTAAGLVEVHELGDKLGWSPEKLMLEQQNYVSDTVKKTTLRIAQSDPLAAEKYMKEKSDLMTASDRYDLDKSLRVPFKEAQSQRAAAEFVQQQTAGRNGSALDMLRRLEGFKSGTYWDVNHHRVGFGSDTVTRADGTVEAVREGMTVTPADAERDLQRRVFITQSKISGTVGQDKWDGLSAPAKAAVTSVAYNYGTLPESVTNAIRTGDPAEIAAAIRGLESHNDGVNKKRRNEEADAVIGADIARDGQAAQNYFTNLETYLSTIKDPDVQDLTRKRINAMLETQHKAATERERTAKATLWKHIDQGATPDQVPMDVRIDAGMAAVSSAWSYLDTVRKGRDIQSDDEMLYGLRRTSAMDPEFFSKIDLNDYRHKLSKSDIKELTGLQTGALTDQRKAREEGLSLTSAFSQATQQLEAVGITASGKKGSQLEAANKRIAQFNNALASQMDEFKRNENRTPTQIEIQSMVNRLLLPVVVKTPGWLWKQVDSAFEYWAGKGVAGPSGKPMWGTNEWKPTIAVPDNGFFSSGEREYQPAQTYAFDTANRPDNSFVEVEVKYESIPIDLRRTIIRDLERETGKQPERGEVMRRYEEFVTRNGDLTVRK